MSFKILMEVLLSKVFYKSLMTMTFVKRLLVPLSLILFGVLYNFFGHIFEYKKIAKDNHANQYAGTASVFSPRNLLNIRNIHTLGFKLYEDFVTTKFITKTKYYNSQKNITHPTDYFVIDIQKDRWVILCKFVWCDNKKSYSSTNYPNVIFFHVVHSLKFVPNKIIKAVYKSNYQLTDFGKDPPIVTQSLFNEVSPHSFGLWLVVAN